MSQVVEKLASTGYLSEEQVERIGESVHEFLKEARANPELMQETMEKLGFGQHLRAIGGHIMEGPITSRVAKGLAIGGGSALGVLGANVGVTALQDLKRDLEKAKHYKAMLDNNPELKGQGVNSKMVQRHFNTLHKFNPEYSTDPMVAGTYVSNSIEMARPNIDVINNLVRARKDIIGARSTMPGQRMAEATTGMAKHIADAAEKARRANEL